MGVAQACHKFLTLDKIKLSLSMKETNCLFFTTLYKETRGTFVLLHETFFYKICGVLKAVIQYLKKTCHRSQRSSKCDRNLIANTQSDHVASHELRYFLMREIGECFHVIDKLTFILFDTSINHGWWKRVVEEILTGFPTAPHLSPRSIFPRLFTHP